MFHLYKVKHVPKEKHILIRKEFANTYSPLTNRLDINYLKWEIEDHYFSYSYPNEYKRIVSLLHEHRIAREYYIHNFVNSLQKSMEEEGVKVEIYGRPKHIYSIWKKMQKKHLSFEELFDIRAVRIIAEQVQYCYTALEIIHARFLYLPNEFDDYIANPKTNGYQSIHTVILGPGSKTIEIQIRTKQMHEAAELGIAAHWKYKENSFREIYFY